MTSKLFLSYIANCTILYIEDDSDIRRYLTEFLSRYCKDVYSASSAEIGFELYNTKKPDIMIVDINLPAMSGMELISTIRKNDESTRIIITTAYTNKEFTIEAIELSLTRYLVKPVTSDDLKDALKKALTELEKISKKISNIDLGKSYIYNTEDNFITKDGKNINLRNKEKQLLDFFVNNKNQIITYDNLENEIWQDEVMTQNAIRSQIKNIRGKTHPNIFKNISKVGYKLYQSDEDE